MAQIVINGIIAGSGYCLVALGFALILRTAGFFDFAYGAMLPVGAYVTLFMCSVVGLPIVLAACLAIVFTCFLASILDQLVFRRLRSVANAELVSMIASIGIYTALQNILSLIFGDGTRRFQNVLMGQGLNVGFANITIAQACIVTSAFLITICFIIAMKTTKFGLKMRAVADSGELASIVGVNRNRVTLAACVLGTATAALAGVLMAFDVEMTPTMGLRPLMMAIVVVIVGGASSIAGLALAAFILGLVQQLAVWWLPAQWQDCIAFAVLLLSMLFRPQGFFGKPFGKGTV